MSRVTEYRGCSGQSFQSTIYPLSKPALLRDIDLGAALDLWKSTDYLATRVGSRPVKIHVSPSPKMDFVSKNFLYRFASAQSLLNQLYTRDLHRTLPFDELIRRCNCSEPKEEYFISPVSTLPAICR